MGVFYSKPDENRKQIADLPLPNEMMTKIFSYLDKKERKNISMVTKRWFVIINSQIEEIFIRTPTQENLDEVRNLINRYPRLKNLELSTEVNKISDFLPLASLDLKGITAEFNITEAWQREENPREALIFDHDMRRHGDANPDSHIERIRINLEDFYFKYHPSQVITFEIDQSRDFEKLKEDIMSFNCVTKIIYSEYDFGGFQQEELKSAQIIESILTRKQLKQVEFHVFFDSNFDYGNEFPKNLTVNEITLHPRSEVLSSNIWSKVFDALPNIKIVKIVTWDTYTFENLVVILRNLLGAFKYLKSLHFAWIASDDERFGSQKIQDCYNFIKENFPLKAKVIIAEYESYDRYEEDVLTNLINKEEGKPPKIVAPGSINN